MKIPASVAVIMIASSMILRFLFCFSGWFQALSITLDWSFGKKVTIFPFIETKNGKNNAVTFPAADKNRLRTLSAGYFYPLPVVILLCRCVFHREFGGRCLRLCRCGREFHLRSAVQYFVLYSCLFAVLKRHGRQYGQYDYRSGQCPCGPVEKFVRLLNASYHLLAASESGGQTSSFGVLYHYDDYQKKAHYDDKYREKCECHVF